MVGVILNLAVWFALHVLFRKVGWLALGPIKLTVPVWGTIDWTSVALTVLAVILLFRTRVGVLGTIGICAFAGVGISAALA